LFENWSTAHFTCEGGISDAEEKQVVRLRERLKNVLKKTLKYFSSWHKKH